MPPSTIGSDNIMGAFGYGEESSSSSGSDSEEEEDLFSSKKPIKNKKPKNSKGNSNLISKKEIEYPCDYIAMKYLDLLTR